MSKSPAVDNESTASDAVILPTFKTAFLEPCKVVALMGVLLPIYVKCYEHFAGLDDSKVGAIVTPTIYCVGLPLVCLGLALFTLGLNEGLMPIGKVIGETLFKTQPKAIPIVGFVLGLLLTFGEPAIGALEEVGSLSMGFPTIRKLLGEYSFLTVAGIGGGVGMAASVGSWRLSLPNVQDTLPMWKVVILPTLLALLCTNFCPSTATGLAWDAGAVTTGPITVPVVLSLGQGVATSKSASFGIVTLASLFPVFGVVFATWIVQAIPDHPGAAVVAAKKASEDKAVLMVLKSCAMLTLRSFTPLILGLGSVLLYLKVPCKDAFLNVGIAVGLAKVFIGLMCFFTGLQVGLLPMGRNGGERMVAGLLDDDGHTNVWGLLGVALFSLCTTLGAQMIEPSLNVLGREAEKVTKGRFQKWKLVCTVASGVSIGSVVGVFKVMYNLPLLYILVPAYIIALLLSYGQDDSCVGIAWDAAGVTTGSITVPLILSLGLGIAEGTQTGNSASASSGPLGILGCASVFPIVFVMIVFRRAGGIKGTAGDIDAHPGAALKAPMIAEEAPGPGKLRNV